MKQANRLMALALARLAAGATGCGGSSAPASSAAEPSGEKHGCNTGADGKHACNTEMKQEDMKGTPPAGEPAPAEKAAPPAGM